jgi:hypothetical protein
MSLRALRFVLAMVVALVGLLGVVSAHEGRHTSDDKYVIYFGWRAEPAFAGLMNGPEVYVSLHDAPEGTAFPEDVPVELQAEVTFGGESTTVTFEAAYGETGHYVADLIPTLPGDYAFRVTGTIGDTVVDEVFDSADGEFSTVEPLNDILFPSSGATDTMALTAKITELETKIAELEARLAELEAK